MNRWEMMCGTCAAFGPQIDHGQNIECDDDGACRFNPPIMMPIGNNGGFGAMFPCVNREDWCKQWTERKGDAE